LVSAEAPAQDALSEIESRLAEVLSRLEAASGGASMCLISRSTGPVDGSKYLEGRMAVLSELRRAIRREPGSALAQVARPIARQWRSDLALQQERGATRGWVAYRAGGVDALDELVGAA
jgi:hypothetical protein